jgi:hypothetical protein
MMTRRVIAIVALFAAACGAKSPSAPGGSETETITGSERLGWEQPAADAGELVTFRYAWYVDGVRAEATSVSCGTGAAAGRFACSSSVPQMPAGPHTLQVAAFVADGGQTLESDRSASLSVVKR